MSELAERLRQYVDAGTQNVYLTKVLAHAADELERLEQERDEAQAEILRLRSIIFGTTQFPCESVNEEEK